MFGNNKKTEAIASAANTSALNSLVQGTTVEGSVKAESDIRIDGVIHGDLTCSAKVIIGPTGSIKGEVRCANAMIEGKFEGTLYVDDLLSVKETASVIGQIHTDKLIVQSGAVFNVTCDMGKANNKKPNQNPQGSARIEQVLKPANVG
jgi:cytoskeletal protein CcmA (bactofilin family)